MSLPNSISFYLSSRRADIHTDHAAITFVAIPGIADSVGDVV